MGLESTTLHVGDDAPDFLLTAANSPLAFQLSHTLKEERKPLVLEFLRGTW